MTTIVTSNNWYSYSYAGTSHTQQVDWSVKATAPGYLDSEYASRSVTINLRRFPSGLITIPNSNWSADAGDPLTTSSRFDYMNTFLNFNPNVHFVIYNTAISGNFAKQGLIDSYSALLNYASQSNTKIVFNCTRMSKAIYNEIGQALDWKIPYSRSMYWMACCEMSRSNAATSVYHKWKWVDPTYLYQLPNYPSYTQNLSQSDVWIYPPTESRTPIAGLEVQLNCKPFTYYRVTYELYYHTGSETHTSNSLYLREPILYSMKSDLGVPRTSSDVNVYLSGNVDEWVTYYLGPYQGSNQVFTTGRTGKIFTDPAFKENYTYNGISSGGLTGWKVVYEFPVTGFSTCNLYIPMTYKNASDRQAEKQFYDDPIGGVSGSVHIANFKIIENTITDDFIEGGVTSASYETWKQCGSFNISSNGNINVEYSKSLENRGLWLQTYRYNHWNPNIYELGVITGSKHQMDTIYSLFGTHSAFGGIFGDEDEYRSAIGYHPYETSSYPGIQQGKVYSTLSRYWATKSNTNWYFYGDMFNKYHSGRKFSMCLNPGPWNSSSIGGELDGLDYLISGGANNIVLSNWGWDNRNLFLYDAKIDYFNEKNIPWLYAYSAYNESYGQSTYNDVEMAFARSRITKLAKEESKCIGIHSFEWFKWNEFVDSTKLIPYQSGIMPSLTSAILVTQSLDSIVTKRFVGTLNVVKFFGDVTY